MARTMGRGCFLGNGSKKSKQILQEDYSSKLPPELLEKVLSLTQPLDLWGGRIVCKAWQSAIENPSSNLLKSLKHSQYHASVTLAIPEFADVGDTPADNILLLNRSMSIWVPLGRLDFLSHYFSEYTVISCVASDGGLLCLGLFNLDTCLEFFVVCNLVTKSCMEIELNVTEKFRENLHWNEAQNETRLLKMVVTDPETHSFELKYWYEYEDMSFDNGQKKYYLRMNYDSVTGVSEVEWECTTEDECDRIPQIADTAVMDGLYYSMFHDMFFTSAFDVETHFSLRWSDSGFFILPNRECIQDDDSENVRDELLIASFGLVLNRENLRPSDVNGSLVVFDDHRLFFAVQGCSDNECDHDPVLDECGHEMHIYEMHITGDDGPRSVKLGVMPEKFNDALFSVPGDDWDSGSRRCSYWSAHQHGNYIVFQAHGGVRTLTFKVPDVDEIVAVDESGADADHSEIDEALWTVVDPPKQPNGISRMHLVTMKFNMGASLSWSLGQYSELQ